MEETGKLKEAITHGLSFSCVEGEIDFVVKHMYAAMWDKIQNKSLNRFKCDSKLILALALTLLTILVTLLVVKSMLTRFLLCRQVLCQVARSDLC